MIKVDNYHDCVIIKKNRRKWRNFKHHLETLITFASTLVPCYVMQNDDVIGIQCVIYIVRLYQIVSSFSVNRLCKKIFSCPKKTNMSGDKNIDFLTTLLLLDLTFQE